MSTLKEWSLGLMFTVMAVSAISLSAASIELPGSLESESYQAKTKVASEKVTTPKSEPTSSNPQVDDKAPDTLSYVNKALQSLFVLSKAGLKIVKSALKFMRRHPGKALTIALAMQNKTSSLRMPSGLTQDTTTPSPPTPVPTAAPLGPTPLIVTNLFQNITSNDTIVTLLPITLSEPKPEDEVFSATLTLRDKNAGNITSCYSFDWTFSDGVWTDIGDFINSALICLQVTRAIGYPYTIYIDSTFSNIEYSVNATQGLIQINWPIADIPSTSVTTQSSSTISTTITHYASSSTALTNQSSSAKNNTETNAANDTSNTLATQPSSIARGSLSTPFQSSSQNPTTPTNSSSVATIPITSMGDGATPSGSHTSSTAFVVPTNEPPYAIIGGAVGGGLLLCSIIAGVVAWVRGWYGMHKASSSEDEHVQELGVQHSSNKNGSSNYGLIIVAQPQSPKKSEYEEPPAAISRFQYDLFPQPSSNSDYVYLPTS